MGNEEKELAKGACRKESSSKEREEENEEQVRILLQRGPW